MPSVVHGRFQPLDVKTFATPPFTRPNPNQLRWDPFDIPDTGQDFIDGMFTICGNGSPDAQAAPLCTSTGPRNRRAGQSPRTPSGLRASTGTA
jgi:homogentisate 1,2-dioxygenase